LLQPIAGCGDVRLGDDADRSVDERWPSMLRRKLAAAIRMRWLTRRGIA
jgi:hypothetical protein